MPSMLKPIARITQSSGENSWMMGLWQTASCAPSFRAGRGSEGTFVTAIISFVPRLAVVVARCSVVERRVNDG
jgi:hypothetical protein